MDATVIEQLFEECCTNRDKFLEALDTAVSKLKTSQSSTGIGRLVEICQTNRSLAVSISDNKFESRFFRLPLLDYMRVDESECQLGRERLGVTHFYSLIADILRAFPNKTDAILKELLVMMRSEQLYDARKTSILSLDIGERLFIAEFKNSIVIRFFSESLFEDSLTRALQECFPNVFNSNVAGYYRYIYNLLNLLDLFNEHNASKVFGHILTKLFEFDSSEVLPKSSAISAQINSTEDALLAVKPEPEDGLFEMEVDAATVMPQETLKPDVNNEIVFGLSVMECTLTLMFEFVDQQLHDITGLTEEDPKRVKAEQMLELITTCFIEMALTSTYVHFQWIIFYAAAGSSHYFEALVNNLWAMALTSGESFHFRQAAFGFLKSFFLVGRFITPEFMFDFLKELLEYITRFVGENRAPEIGKYDTDHCMFIIIAAGFIEIFCAVHSTIEPIKIQLLRNLNIRLVLENDFHPVCYLEDDTRRIFQRLVNFYRFGYVNIFDEPQKHLESISGGVTREFVKLDVCLFDSICDRLRRYVLPSHSFKYVHDLDTDFSSTKVPLKRKRLDSEVAVVVGSPFRKNFNMRTTPKKIGNRAYLDYSATSDDNQLATSYNSNRDFAASPNFVMGQMLH